MIKSVLGGLSKTITSEFWKRFKSNISINPAQAILFLIQRTKTDNEILIIEVSDAELFVKPINPLKSPRSRWYVGDFLS